MLPRIHRLTKTKEINNALRFGRKFNTKSFTISVVQNQPSPKLQNPLIVSQYDKEGNFLGKQDNANFQIKKEKITHNGKLCIIVSTKYGKANKRNLLRRRIRNILREFVLNSELSTVIQVKKGTKLLEFKEIEFELTEIFKNLK